MFQAHADLLRLFLVRRDEIVERIQDVLNAQRKPAGYLQDGPLLAHHVEDCFFTLDGLTTNQARLRGQLEAAHWASGFRPREIPGLHNGPADPAEMMMRAFYMWRQTRWPGRNGRLRYAHTLFNLYVVGCLELLALRIWDDGMSGAGDRLACVQAVLDELWHGSAAGQPVLVRDARWLIQLAQSLATDDLGAYFGVAERIAGSLSEADRTAIHAAAVRMAGGHLRSQVRYHATKTTASLDEASVVPSTRDSNALDFALLVQDLVPLFDAYEAACAQADRARRLELADAICQGVSPDPELFLNRVDLLGAYTMLEQLFVRTDRDGRASYTPMGRRHVQLLREYETRIGRVSQLLLDDCAGFRPAAGSYSPYGVLYGFSADLLKHIVLKASQPDAMIQFGLEDVFVAGGADKLAWVTGWRRLPHLTRDVEKLFDYPQAFAEHMFDRVAAALRRRVSEDDANAAARAGRLVIISSDDEGPGSTRASQLPDLPRRYVRSSDPQMVASHRAEPYNESDLLNDRREGKFVVCYQTPNGWAAITKAVLTDVVGAGRDVKVVGLPAVAASVLTLTCARLAEHASTD